MASPFCAVVSTNHIPLCDCEFYFAISAPYVVVQESPECQGIGTRISAVVQGCPSETSEDCVGNHLGHCGMDRILDHGERGFARAVGLSFLSANLKRLARIVRDKEHKNPIPPNNANRVARDRSPSLHRKNQFSGS